MNWPFICATIKQSLLNVTTANFIHIYEPPRKLTACIWRYNAFTNIDGVADVLVTMKMFGFLALQYIYVLLGKQALFRQYELREQNN